MNTVATPTPVQGLLDEIGRLLEATPLDLDAVTGALTSLARSFAIDPAGPVDPPDFKPVSLGLTPALPLPPVPVAGGSARISHSLEWRFFEGRNRLSRDDVFAESLTRPTISALLKPKVVEAPARAGDVRVISPRVKLTLSFQPPGGGQPVSATVELPGLDDLLPTTIRVPAIAIPTLLALFRHKRFAPRQGPLNGFVLIVTDPAPGKPLATLLDDLRIDVVAELVDRFALPDVLGPVGGIDLDGENLLGFLAGQLVRGGQPLVRVLDRREIARLRNVGIPNIDSKLDAGNAISSLIFVGVGSRLKGRTVECWSGALDDTSKAHFALDSGGRGCAVIPDLHSDRPTTLPAQKQFRRGKRPGAANTFGDAISAIRFLPASGR